jgi:hypothetical protein
MIMMSRVAGKGLIARSFASLTVRDALNAAMVEEMTLNPKVSLPDDADAKGFPDGRGSWAV